MSIGPKQAILLLTGALLTTCASVAVLRSRASSTAPKCEILDKTIHASARPQDRTLESVLRVRNAGGGTLRILKVTSSCGCTVASVEPKTLETGQQAVVRLVADAPPGGDKRVTITILSNDPEQPEQDAFFTMSSLRSLPYVDQMPSGLTWTPQGADDRLTFTIRTLEPPGSEAWLQSPQSSEAALHVTGSVLKEHAGFGGKAIGREYLFEVELVDVTWLPKKRKNAELRFAGPNGLVDDVRVPLIVEPPLPIVVAPSLLYANVESDQKEVKFKILASKQGPNEPLEFRLKSEMPGLTCQVLNREPRRVVLELTLDLEVSSPDELSNLKILFATNDPRAPEIEVPLIIKRR